MLMGMFYSTVSTKSFVYFFYLLLLIPGIFVSINTADFNIDIKKALVFNLSGPVCLAISSIYMYKRKVLFTDLQNVVLVIGLPIVTTLVFIFLYNPSVKDVVTGTQSNFETSGGFGPNQVSTVLGLGIFIFFVQLMLNSSNGLLQIVNGALVMVFAFRGLVTFSRGGIYTGVAMVLLLLAILYFQANFQTKPKIAGIILLSFLATLAVWSYSSIKTNGLLGKRYANQDAAGREKKSQLSGREVLIESELNMFYENPILGVGVGKNKELRATETGIQAASHNEMSRMLAEHGTLGIIGLLILIITPLYLFIVDRQNILALSFFVFWLLTINHAAMRLSAPAFIYALSLLKVYREAPAIHRK